MKRNTLVIANLHRGSYRMSLLVWTVRHHSSAEPTDDSYIRGHKVVLLLKIAVECAEFTTPTKLAAQIDNYRKQVSKGERRAYIKAYTKYKPTNSHRADIKRDKPPAIGSYKSSRLCLSWP